MSWTCNTRWPISHQEKIPDSHQTSGIFCSLAERVGFECSRLTKQFQLGRADGSTRIFAQQALNRVEFMFGVAVVLEQLYRREPELGVIVFAPDMYIAVFPPSRTRRIGFDTVRCEWLAWCNQGLLTWVALYHGLPPCARRLRSRARRAS